MLIMNSRLSKIVTSDVFWRSRSEHTECPCRHLVKILFYGSEPHTSHSSQRMFSQKHHLAGRKKRIHIPIPVSSLFFDAMKLIHQFFLISRMSYHHLYRVASGMVARGRVYATRPFKRGARAYLTFVCLGTK